MDTRELNKDQNQSEKKDQYHVISKEMSKDNKDQLIQCLWTNKTF